MCRADIVFNGRFNIEFEEVKNKLSDTDTDRRTFQRYMRVLKINFELLVNFEKELQLEEIIVGFEYFWTLSVFSGTSVFFMIFSFLVFDVFEGHLKTRKAPKPRK